MTVDGDGLLEWLEQWYVSHCDGNWEHQYGVRVDTLDNPGWSVQIDVGGDLNSFERIRWERGSEWLRAWLEDGQLNVVCGPRSLHRALSLARDALAQADGDR